MLKSCFWRLLASVFAVVCVSTAFAVDEKPVPSITVSVSPGAQTVKVRPNGAAETEYNTATYTIRASCDPKSDPKKEVMPVDPSWSITYSSAFIPPEGVTPVPQNQGDPTIVPLPRGNDSWDAKVSSPNAGQWEITFTATVTYKLKNSVTGEYVLNDDGTMATREFLGHGKCHFTATQKPFTVKLSVAPVICRHSTNPPKRPVEEVTATLVDADEAQTILFTRQGGGLVCFGENADNATASSITQTIQKDGKVKFWVSGEQESQAMNDAIINANSTDTNPEIVGSAATTVLWVAVAVRDSGVFSEDNDKRDH